MLANCTCGLSAGKYPANDASIVYAGLFGSYNQYAPFLFFHRTCSSQVYILLQFHVPLLPSNQFLRLFDGRDEARYDYPLLAGVNF
jgi:hypothetical protein